MSAILLPPFVASTSQIEVNFEVLEDSCNGVECNLVRLDQVAVFLCSQAVIPNSVIRIREHLNQVNLEQNYKADGLGVPAKFWGMSFDSRMGGYGSKLFFSAAFSASTMESIIGLNNNIMISQLSSVGLAFPDSPSWPLSPSNFSSLGLLALEVQPMLVSSSGSCFIKMSEKTVLVTVSSGNLVALNILSSGSFILDHVIVTGTEFGCASSSGPTFMSTDNRLFAVVNDKFVRQDMNRSTSFFCRVLGESCVQLLSSGALLFSSSPINIPVFYDDQHQVLHGMFLLKTQDGKIRSSRIHSAQRIFSSDFTTACRFTLPGSKLRFAQFSYQEPVDLSNVINHHVRYCG